MTDHKFTDDDVIKALECCSDTKDLMMCQSCPYESRGCNIHLLRDALALINRQKIEIESLKIANEKMYSANKEQEAEIERLKEEANKYPCRVRMNENSIVRTKSLEDYDRLLGDISAEAIKEFAERLREIARMPLGTLYGTMVYLKDIDTLVKEMTEEQTNESQST